MGAQLEQRCMAETVREMGPDKHTDTNVQRGPCATVTSWCWVRTALRWVSIAICVLLMVGALCLWCDSRTEFYRVRREGGQGLERTVHLFAVEARGGYLTACFCWST